MVISPCHVISDVVVFPPRQTAFASVETRLHTKLTCCVLCLYISASAKANASTLFALQFLEYYGLPQHDITKWEYLGIEMLFFIMFFILAWLALKYKKHGNR